MVNCSIQYPFGDMRAFGLLRRSAEESRDYHSLNVLSDSFLRPRQLPWKFREPVNPEDGFVTIAPKNDHVPPTQIGSPEKVRFTNSSPPRQCHSLNPIQNFRSIYCEKTYVCVLGRPEFNIMRYLPGKHETSLGPLNALRPVRARTSPQKGRPGAGISW
jgi:hypothetical protein